MSKKKRKNKATELNPCGKIPLGRPWTRRRGVIKQDAELLGWGLKEKAMEKEGIGWLGVRWDVLQWARSLQKIEERIFHYIAIAWCNKYYM